jgi:hypothetical protein
VSKRARQREMRERVVDLNKGASSRSYDFIDHENVESCPGGGVHPDTGFDGNVLPALRWARGLINYDRLRTVWSGYVDTVT